MNLAIRHSQNTKISFITTFYAIFNPLQQQQKNDSTMKTVKWNMCESLLNVYQTKHK